MKVRRRFISLVTLVLSSNITVQQQSDQSLLRRRLQHEVELQPGRHHLLLTGVVRPVLRSFLAGQVNEHDEAYQGHEEHPAQDGGDDEGEDVTLLGPLVAHMEDLDIKVLRG